MRILIGSIMHESNTFNPVPTSFRDFRARYGGELLAQATGSLRGIIDVLQAKGVELIPTVAAHALPGGVVAREAYEPLKAALVEGIGRAGHLDAVCLALHGAMVVEEIGDGESDLLAAVRAAVGPRVPVVAALDMHANLIATAVESADALVAYRTAPHVDVEETGQRAARLLWRILREGLRPTMAFAKVPILMPGEMAQTPYEPMATLMRMLEETDKLPGVLTSSITKAHCWQDVADQGDCGIVVTDGDSALAQREASRLAQAFWDRRAQFNYGMEAYPVDQAIRVALSAPQSPVLLSDSGDNPTAGGTTDVPLALARLLAHQVPSALVAAMWDAQAVEACRAVGEGSRLALAIGGKLVPHYHPPLAVEGAVRRLLDSDLGPMAILRVAGVDVLLSQRRVSVYDPAVMARLGINPFDYKIVVIKVGYVPQGIAPRCILMLTPGCTNCDVTKLDYRRVRRPIYPLDPDAVWPGSRS